MEQFDPPVGGMSGATVVLLNGPPRCGKDTAGAYLARKFDNSMVLKFAGPLKRLTHVGYGLPPNIPDDYFEQVKDQPLDAFFGLSPRQAYIKFSEEQIKPFLGDEHFGKLFRRRMWREYCAGKRVFLSTDSGFATETNPVIQSIKPENVLLVRIHAEARGVSFKNDSRSYIELPEVTTYDIENNSSVEAFQKVVHAFVEPFVLTRFRFSTPLPLFP